MDDMVNRNDAAILPSYDDTALCSAAFRVMRSMINGWLREVTMNRNVFSDFQIVHFYRWVRSSNALLYDPALRRALNNLMRKMFLQIIAEFQRLGAEIVFADFNRIIVNTNKKSVVDAIGYVEYIVQSIRHKEIFHSIHLSYQQCWDFLWWLDTANFSGVRGKLPKNIDADNAESTEETENNEDEVTMDMNWNIGELLSDDENCREHFETVLTAFMEALADGTTPKNAVKDVSHLAFEATQRLHTNFAQGYESPALHFINALCKILFTNQKIEEDVSTMSSQTHLVAQH